MGPTYDRLGYKRLIVDYHFSAFVPGTLSKASAGDYVAACASTGADAVLIYAKDHWGHCYYATDTFPRHPNVPQDLFGEVLTGLKARGLTGYAYFSVGWDEQAARANPDWAMRGADGRPLRRRAPAADQVTGRWTYLCVNSPYRDYALAQIAEILQGYPFPALFLDILFLNTSGHVCHCEHCRARWALEHTEALPSAFTPAYLDFAIETLGRFQRDVKRLAARTGRKAQIEITHNFGLPHEDDDYVTFEVNPLGRNYLRGSGLAKIMRAEADGREVELIGHRFHQDWDFTTKAATLMQWEAATVLAHNCALMWVDQPNMDGTFDGNALAAIQQSFATVDELAPHVRGSVPWAEIGLLYGERSILLDPDEEQDFVGAYKLLTAHHWPFDVVTERQLTVERLRAYRLLIVPNVRHLTPEAAAAIDAYVRQGGALFFTHHTATESLTAQPLSARGFGIVDVEAALPFPASFMRPAQGVELGSTHLRVEETLRFHAPPGVQILATHVAPNITVTDSRWVSHNVAPGEDTALPAVVTGNAGAGRYVYAAPRLFAEVVRQGLPALSQFVTHLMGTLITPSLWVEAPGIVEATYLVQDGDLVICLVNGLVEKTAIGGFLHLREAPAYLSPVEVVPIADLHICLRGHKVLEARDGTGKALAIAVAEHGEQTTITLERLDLYAVVRISAGD